MKIPKIESGVEINRLNRNFWILKPALEAAGLHTSKMKRVLEDLLLEIEAGPANVKALRATMRSTVQSKLKQLKWRGPAGARADELKHKNPKLTPESLAALICGEKKIPGLPGKRTVADFLRLPAEARHPYGQSQAFQPTQDELDELEKYRMQ